MNAISPIPLPAGELWNDATTAVNCWRGEAMHWFTRTELVVSEVLLLLSPDTRTDRLVGMRFKSLAAVLKERPASEKILAALDAFTPLLERRVAFCHGSAKVSLDRNGAWVARFKWLELGKKPPKREASWDQADAAAFLAELKRRSTELISRLQQLRKPPTPAPASTAR